MYLHLFGTSYWTFTVFLWWYQVSLILHDSCCSGSGAGGQHQSVCSATPSLAELEPLLLKQVDLPVQYIAFYQMRLFPSK